MTEQNAVAESGTIAYEVATDLCPVCHAQGMAPCYAADGSQVPDHDGRPVAFAATQ